MRWGKGNIALSLICIFALTCCALEDTTHGATSAKIERIRSILGKCNVTLGDEQESFACIKEYADSEGLPFEYFLVDYYGEKIMYYVSAECLRYRPAAPYSKWRE
jgi:hypothetical protein